MDILSRIKANENRAFKVDKNKLSKEMNDYLFCYQGSIYEQISQYISETMSPDNDIQFKGYEAFKLLFNSGLFAHEKSRFLRVDSNDGANGTEFYGILCNIKNLGILCGIKNPIYQGIQGIHDPREILKDTNVRRTFDVTRNHCNIYSLMTQKRIDEFYKNLNL